MWRAMAGAVAVSLVLLVAATAQVEALAVRDGGQAPVLDGGSVVWSVPMARAACESGPDLRFCARWVLGAETAGDLCAETFAQALRSRRGFRCHRDRGSRVAISSGRLRTSPPRARASSVLSAGRLTPGSCQT
jgi:hypothetical protein